MSQRAEKLVLHHQGLVGARRNFIPHAFPYQSLIFAIVIKLRLAPINTY